VAIRSEMECSKIMCDWKDYELDYFMNIQPVEATVKSKDGTPIYFIRLGTGPSLVIVYASITAGNAYLQEQGHAAHLMAPQMLADVVISSITTTADMSDEQ